MHSFRCGFEGRRETVRGTSDLIGINPQRSQFFSQPLGRLAFLLQSFLASQEQIALRIKPPQPPAFVVLAPAVPGPQLYPQWVNQVAATLVGLEPLVMAADQA